MPSPAPDQVLNRIDWQVIRRLDGALQGDYRSLFYGGGLDLAELREYQPYDDIRLIDWNVTARMTTPYVRQYHEDREIMAWFLLDLTPSIDFGTVKTLKRNLVMDFTAVLARLLTRRGNRVGAILFGDRIDRVIPARGGKMQVLRILNDVMKQPKLKHASFTNLATLMEAAHNAIHRRSLIFILSDFISTTGWERPLTMLNQHNEVLAVRLWDPREVELPDVGPIIMEDAETGEQLFVNTSDKKFRKRFTDAARRREDEMNAAFRHAGVDVLSLSTEDDMVRAIVRFAGLRKQRRRYASGSSPVVAARI